MPHPLLNKQHATVIAHSSQVVDFLRQGNLNTIFLCLNFDTYEFCVQQRLPCFLLDEELIESEYKRLNSWGIEHTFNVIESFTKSKKEYAFFGSNFMYVEGLFTQVAKICLVFDQILTQSNLDSIYIYNDPQSPLFSALNVFIPQGYPGVRVVALTGC